ncbi:TauD/TfdA family dioxygenase [Tardiphaga sp. 285_C5_N1_2]
MTNEARELDRLIEQKLSHSESVQIQWEKNCLLVIDNHRMVHARGLAKRPDANRTLKRILIGGN